MRAVCVFGYLILLASCSGTPEVPPTTQAIRDYVDVGELREVDRIRTHTSDAWRALSEHFVIYESRDGAYLLEFRRTCRELTDRSVITPDRRRDHNVMRRGIDTLRGCTIGHMYPLTEGQAVELESLGRAATVGN